MDLITMTQWIDDLLGFGPRRPGQDAGHQTEDYLERTFKKIGLQDVKKEEIPIRNWIESSWFLKIKTDGGEFRKLPSHYIPYTAFTDRPVTAPLIYAGEGKITDIRGLNFKDKIVVVEFPFPMLEGGKLSKLALSVIDPEKKLPPGPVHEATWIRPAWHVYHKAVAAGAKGFIGILVNQPGGLDSYYAPYGFKEGDAIHEKPIPGFWVGREAGKELVKMAREGREVQIDLKGKSEESHTANILGYIHGKNKETIIIACHHDSPFDGAVEDASGLSVVLQIARSLVDKGIEPEKNLLFMATGGHFYGSIGTRSFIHNHPEIIKDTVAEIHIEHIGLEAKETNSRLEITVYPEPAALFVPYNKKCVQLGSEILRENNIDPTLLLPAEGPLGPYPPTDGGDFHLEKIPVFNFISNPVYLLVDFDKREHICFERLVPVAKAFESLVLKLDKVNKNELRRKAYFLKRLIGKYASWKTAGRIMKIHGKDVKI